MIRIQKATDARQIRHELSVVRFSPKGHWIKPVDEVTALLKFQRLEEQLRDVYAVAVRIAGSAVVDCAGPAGEAERVRFTAEEVYVLLAHKEVCVVYRIGAVHSFVVGDGHGCGRLCAQGGTARTVETDGEGFAAFGVRVIDNGNRESLWRSVAGRPGSSAYGVLVITARRSSAVEDIAIRQASRVVGREGDRSAAGGIASARQGDVRARPCLADGIGSSAELDRRWRGRLA